jgi:hypothetical protein
MFERKTLSNSITMALATSAGMLSGSVMAAENVLEEVTVTATKRVENLQDVPFAVSALGQEKLDELNITNFDDYIRYLPGVNSAGRGPGQSSIFIRGMATDSSDQTSIEIGAPVPNVALYLDEQPVSSGAARTPGQLVRSQFHGRHHPADYQQAGVQRVPHGIQGQRRFDQGRRPQQQRGSLYQLADHR